MGVKLSQLQLLLSYIYIGHCDLTQNQLPAFMATGKQLEVEGLSGDWEEKAPSGDVGGNLQNQYEIQEKKLPAIVENDPQLKNAELNENFDDIRMPQEHEDDEIEKTVPLNDNATFEANAPMPSSEKSIIASQSNTSGKQLQCQFCDYRPASTSHMKRHFENVHQGLKYDCADCDYKMEIRAISRNT